MEFSSAFDQALAASGPAAIFLFDSDRCLRFQPTWTRDAYGRAPEHHALDWVWLLARDNDSGFVQIVFVTSPTLLVEHPRLALRSFESLDEAQEALRAFGSPPIAAEPW
jgi:hypothetical protein